MDSIELAISEIKKHNPVFGRFYDCEDNLREHSAEIQKADIPDYVLKRQAFYKSLINKKIQGLFGNNFSYMPIPENQPLVVSTVDHHGLLNHPIPTSASFASRYATILDRDEAPDIVTLSTGNVPVNNALFKRGISFADKHINMFTRNEYNRLVLSQKNTKLSLAALATSSANKEALKNKGIKEFSDEEVSFLKEIDENIISKHSVSGMYSDQCTVWNHYLWERLVEPELREHLLRLFVLQGEDLDCQFLIDVVKNHQDSFVYRIIFDEETRKLAIKMFDGLYGCWNLKNHSGTMFFFVLNERGKRVDLWVDGDKLRDEKGIFTLSLNEQDVIDALTHKTIYPSILTTFLMIAFWAGIKCLGGVNQIRYLTDYKNTLTKLLEGIGDKDKQFVETVDLLGVNTFSIFFKKINNAPKELFAFDVFYQGGITRQYLDNIGHLTVRDVLMPSLPFFYSLSVPEKYRKDIQFNPTELNRPLLKLFN